MTDAIHSVVDLLAGQVAAGTDSILREAVTRFMGRDDWKIEELTGRCVMARLPGGVKVFNLDGVAIVELHPISVEHVQNGASNAIHAMRQYRFLIA